MKVCSYESCPNCSISLQLKTKKTTCADKKGNWGLLFLPDRKCSQSCFLCYIKKTYSSRKDRFSTNIGCNSLGGLCCKVSQTCTHPWNKISAFHNTIATCWMSCALHGIFCQPLRCLYSGYCGNWQQQPRSSWQPPYPLPLSFWRRINSFISCHVIAWLGICTCLQTTARWLTRAAKCRTCRAEWRKKKKSGQWHQSRFLSSFRPRRFVPSRAAFRRTAGLIAGGHHQQLTAPSGEFRQDRCTAGVIRGRCNWHASGGGC